MKLNAGHIKKSACARVYTHTNTHTHDILITDIEYIAYTR